MKRKYLIGSVFVAIFAIATLIVSFAGYQNVAKAIGFSFGEKQYISSIGTGNSLGAGDNRATTTLVYMSTAATASTTISGSYGLGSELNIYVNAIGSSSAAVLGFTIETSYNNIDWFPIDQATTTNSSVHDAIETRNTFSLATSSATGNTIRKHFKFTFGSASYYRVRFGVSGANAALWAMAYPRDEVPN